MACAPGTGRTKVAASFTSTRLLPGWLLLALRHGEVAGDAPAALVHSRRSAVDDRPARIQIDHEPRPVELIGSAIELDVADQGDQLAIEIVDAELAPCG